MTVAAAQAAKFYEQVVAESHVFTFLDEGSFLVFPIHGYEVVPFWSSRTRLESIQRNHPKYRAFVPDEIALETFLGDTLEQLEAEAIRVGVNWSGKRLGGYDLTVADLRRNLEYWKSRIQ